MTRTVLGAALLALIYAMTLASFDPVDLGVGFALALALLWLFRRFLSSTELPSDMRFGSRLLWLFPMVGEILRQITVGTFMVTRVTLGFRPLHRPGIVAIPIEERTPTGVAVTALALTLSPGELLVDVDEDRGLMYIHVIEIEDADEVREEHRSFYRRFQRKVFP